MKKGTDKSAEVAAQIPPVQDKGTRGSDLRKDLRKSGYEEGRDKQAPKKNGAEIYEQALGEMLGSKLFKLVQEHLSLEKIQGYSGAALEGVMDALSGVAQEKASGEDEKELTKKVMAEVSKEFLKAADKWLESENGQAFAGKVAGFMEEHPKTLVVVALLAAVGAVVANVDVPTLKYDHKFSKELKGSVSVDPAGIRDLALKSIGASLSYHKKNFKLSGEVKHKIDGATSGAVVASVTSGATTYKTKAKLDGDGVLESEIGASWVADGAKAKVDDKDGKVTTEATVKHHSDDGISVRLGQKFVGGGLSEHFDGQDASANYSIEHGMQTGATTLAAGLSLTKPDLLKTDITAALKLAQGGAFDSGSLGFHREYLTGRKSSYDVGLEYGQDDSILSLGASTHVGDNSEIGGKLKTTFSGDLRHVSAFYGYEEENFQKLFFEFSREAGLNRSNEDKFFGSYERVFTDQYAAKIYGTSKLTDGHFTTGSLGIMGGYNTSIGSEPLKLFAGFEQGFDEDGIADPAVKFGFEVREIPVEFTVDMDKNFTIRLVKHF